MVSDLSIYTAYLVVVVVGGGHFDFHWRHQGLGKAAWGGAPAPPWSGQVLLSFLALDQKPDKPWHQLLSGHLAWHLASLLIRESV